MTTKCKQTNIIIVVNNILNLFILTSLYQTIKSPWGRDENLNLLELVFELNVVAYGGFWRVCN